MLKIYLITQVKPVIQPSLIKISFVFLPGFQSEIKYMYM